MKLQENFCLYPQLYYFSLKLNHFSSSFLLFQSFLIRPPQLSSFSSFPFNNAYHVNVFKMCHKSHLCIKNLHLCRVTKGGEEASEQRNNFNSSVVSYIKTPMLACSKDLNFTTKAFSVAMLLQMRHIITCTFPCFSLAHSSCLCAYLIPPPHPSNQPQFYYLSFVFSITPSACLTV